MVSYIFTVAVLNLVLGFAAAVCLARKYRELTAARSGHGDSAAPPAPPALEQPASADAAEAPEDTAAQDESPADDAGPLTAAGSAMEEEDAGQTPSGGEDPDAETPADEHEESQAAPEPLETRRSEVPVTDAQDELEHYRRELDRLENAARGGRADPQTSTCGPCPDPLELVNAESVEPPEEVLRSDAGLHAEPEESCTDGEGPRAAIPEQDARVEQTDHTVEEPDGKAGLNERCRQPVARPGEPPDVGHDLRDALEQAAVAAAGVEDRWEPSGIAGEKDSLTGLATRAALEASLDEWWQENPHHARHTNVAMVDVDEFAKLNERHGREVGDRILQAVARLLTAQSHRHYLAARFSGGRFVLLFRDVDLHRAASVIERIRQTIEVSRLDHLGQEIRITASCAVVEAIPGDTSQTLFARAEATLREAKRYGRNRSFIHRGKYPAPVVPPSFTLEEKSIRI